MSSNTVRTVVIFGIIALVLGGAAVGGLRLMKARNASYASSQTQQTAAADTPKQPVTQQPKQEAKKDESKNTPQPASNDQSKTTQDQQKVADTKPATPTPAPTPSQPSTPQTSTPPPAPDTKNNALPATSGFSPADFFATFVLMLAAAFFGSKLLKARADYRRYLNLQ